MVSSSSTTILVLTALTFLLLGTASCAKILFLLPVASKSHIHVFEPLIQALGERGHEITSFTPQASKGMPPNVRQIVIVPVEEIFKHMDSPFKLRKDGKLSQFSTASVDYIDKTCRRVLVSPEMKEIMANNSFDLIVVDILMNQCTLGLIPHFKSPSIYVSTLVAPSFLVEPLGNRLPPSFVPSPFLTYTHRMTFLERVKNVSFNFLLDMMGHFVFVPFLEQIYKDTLGINDSLYDIDANVSMVFVNSHFSLTYPRPYLPDVVDVGGMHARPSKPLPKDLEDFISGAEHGCIFFSLGSIAQGKDMPEEYRKVFVNVFSKLKQRVLWKWESDSMPDKPSNVKLIQWAPQQDILAHKNVKVFLSHGGLLSVQEAVYHAVPIVGIPLFADQDLNIKQTEEAGFALSVEILELNETTLTSKLNEVLRNPSYETRVKELSTIWRDQTATPLETAVFWSEYVIRHKGAVHLRSAARDLNFFQYHSLDVIATLSVVLIGIVLLIAKLLKFIARKLCSIMKGGGGREKAKQTISKNISSKKIN